MQSAADKSPLTSQVYTASRTPLEIRLQASPMTGLVLFGTIALALEASARPGVPGSAPRIVLLVCVGALARNAPSSTDVFRLRHAWM